MKLLLLLLFAIAIRRLHLKHAFDKGAFGRRQGLGTKLQDEAQQTLAAQRELLVLDSHTHRSSLLYTEQTIVATAA